MQHERFNVDGVAVCAWGRGHDALFPVSQSLRKDLKGASQHDDLSHRGRRGLPFRVSVPGPHPTGMVLTQYSGEGLIA
jgi:hypothetical protein